MARLRARCGSGCAETTCFRPSSQVADQPGRPDTSDAGYVALTQLQADASITLDRQPADTVKDLAAVAPIEVLFRSKHPLQTAAAQIYSSG
jgi:hypothetical protein